MYCKNHCYSVQIRASAYKLVVSLCQYCGDFVLTHGRQFCPLVLSSLGEKEPGVVGPLWDAVLLTTSLCQVNNTHDNLFGNCCWNPIHQQFCQARKTTFPLIQYVCLEVYYYTNAFGL